MTTSPKPIPMKPWFVGWAFELESHELNFKFFGSPFEIVQQMKQANIEPKYAATHTSTQIKVSMVNKDGRAAHFPGGPNAQGLMRLLDATGANDWNTARRVVRQYPTLLTTGDETASVPLCINVALGQTETVEFLIASGAPLNAAGKFGMTALHWAAVHNQPAIAKMLLDAGADRSLRSWFFLTPANLSHANRHGGMLRLLAPGNPDASKVKIMEILQAMACA